MSGAGGGRPRPSGRPPLRRSAPARETRPPADGSPPEPRGHRHKRRRGVSGPGGRPARAPEPARGPLPRRRRGAPPACRRGIAGEPRRKERHRLQHDNEPRRLHDRDVARVRAPHFVRAAPSASVRPACCQHAVLDAPRPVSFANAQADHRADGRPQPCGQHHERQLPGDRHRRAERHGSRAHRRRPRRRHRRAARPAASPGRVVFSVMTRRTRRRVSTAEAVRATRTDPPSRRPGGECRPYLRIGEVSSFPPGSPGFRYGHRNRFPADGTGAGSLPRPAAVTLRADFFAW